MEGTEMPILVSNFPQGGSFTDYYFSLELTEWVKFSLEDSIDSAKYKYEKSIPSQRKVSNFLIPTAEMLRQSFVLECLITSSVSTLVAGPQFCGKSTLIKTMLNETIFEFDKKVMV
jgi:hypothetical protein